MKAHVIISRANGKGGYVLPPFLNSLVREKFGEYEVLSGGRITGKICSVSYRVSSYWRGTDGSF